MECDVFGCKNKAEVQRHGFKLCRKHAELEIYPLEEEAKK